MTWRARLARDWRYYRGLIRTLRRVGGIAGDSRQLACDDLEDAVDRWGDRPAVSCAGRTISYREFDALANRYAHWAKSQNLRQGSTVALLMQNRPDYLAVWYGLMKVGCATALVNTHLTGEALAHSLRAAKASAVITDETLAEAAEAARQLLDRPPTLWTLGPVRSGWRDLGKALKSASALRPDGAGREGMTAGDTALYIFTSGTTGLPKAARIPHTRVQLFMRGFAGSTGSTEADRIYDCLPLYHATGGLCAVGAALLNGGCLVLRERFSASGFWEDVAAEACTMFVYIGELGRYLVNSRPGDGPADIPANTLRLAFGNGMGPAVWEELQRRFGVPQVLEFYGSTEGNVSMFNFDGKVGAIGRVPKRIRGRFNMRLVRYDVEAEGPWRGPNGLCREAGTGEIGEAVGEIGADARSNYTGYADKAESEKKVLHDVFVRGDRWFRTGDLMRQDGDGYFYFVDRIGDTFRWKGENVSTTEVAERLALIPGVAEAVVYGVAVPGAEGRAGMAALVTEGAFDPVAFGAAVERDLPAYARPLFLRVRKALETTATFKPRKVDLVAQGYGAAVGEQLWVRDEAKGYVRLTKAMAAKFDKGEVRV